MWYGVALMFKASHVNHPDRESVWEERVVLVEAGNEADAELMAEGFGKQGEHEYYVSKAENDLLRWAFVRVSKVYPIEDDALGSGTELFSRFLTESQAVSLLKPFAQE